MGTLPIEVEFQDFSGDKEMQRYLNSNGYNNTIVLQQNGLKNKETGSFETYFRYVIKLQKTSIEYPLLYKEIKRDPKNYIQIIEQEVIKINPDCLNEDSCLLSFKTQGPYFNGSIIYYTISYKRNSIMRNFEGQKIIMKYYFLYRPEGLYTIKTSYIENHEKKWVNVINKLNNQNKLFKP
jgi:hypothetical protein